MCGYIGRVTDNPFFQELMLQIGLQQLYQPLLSAAADIEQFYPAFGGNPQRLIRGLVIEEDGEKKLIDATWWFDCSENGDDLTVGKMTTFNARNLASPFWQGALQTNRAVVIATELGESKFQNRKKHQYLMQGERPFLLGALYRKFPNGKYSCAVITRDSHPKFEPYHEKAFPLFLPPDAEFIAKWLAKDVTELHEFDELLKSPKLYPALTVAEVKTFKAGKKVGEDVFLASDLAS